MCVRERERHISTLGLSAMDIEEGLRKDSEAEPRVCKPESCHEYHLHYWCEEQRVWREETHLKWFCSLPYLSLYPSRSTSRLWGKWCHRGSCSTKAGKRIFLCFLMSDACMHAQQQPHLTHSLSLFLSLGSFSQWSTSLPHLHILKVPVSLCIARKIEWFNQWNGGERGRNGLRFRCKWCNAL